MAVWMLRSRKPGHGAIREQSFHEEAEFKLWLQRAYREGATDFVVRLPDGRTLSEAALRVRYPPE